MTDTKDPLIGSTFADRYRVERRLGEGGMGAVYVARQLSMNRDVALKVLHAEMSGSESAAQRFVREMQATSKVEHANTIRVYDFGRSDDGRLFLAMELLDGRSLHQVLRQDGPLDVARVIHIGTQVARALVAAHEEGIVHRDLKPENVMLMDRYGDRDIAKVLDFGIARFAAAAEPEDTPQLTKTGSLIGTPLYMSPEQALGKPVDHRSDIYALGVLMYQMATGVPPFTDPRPVRVLFMHAHEPPTPPRERVGDRLPEALEQLIMRSLAKRPEDRPQTAAEVVRALRLCTEGETLVEPGGLPRVPTNPTWEENAPTEMLMMDPASGPRAVATVEGTGMSALEITAPTMEGDLADLTAPTVQELLETAETMIAEPAAADAPAHAPAGAEGPAAAAPAVAVPTSQDPAPAPPTDELPLPGPRTIPQHAIPGSQDAPTVEQTPPASAGGGKGWIGPVAALVVALAAGGWWLASQGAPADGVADPAPQAPPAAAAQATQAPDISEFRAKLDALARADGDPLPPAGCQSADPGLLAALVTAGELLAGGAPRSRRDQDKQAMAQLQALETRHKGAVEFDVMLAKARLYGGASDPAIIEAARRAVDKCPTHALAHGLVGRVHLLGDRREVAAKHYRVALTHAPDFARAHYNLGLAALGRQQPEEARTHFDAALKIRPDDDGALLARGQARLLSGDAAGAVTDLERLTARSPKDALGWFLLGGARERAGQAAPAAEAWCQAAALGHKAAGKLCPTAAPPAAPLNAPSPPDPAAPAESPAAP